MNGLRLEYNRLRIVGGLGLGGLGVVGLNSVFSEFEDSREPLQPLYIFPILANSGGCTVLGSGTSQLEVLSRMLPNERLCIFGVQAMASNSNFRRFRFSI